MKATTTPCRTVTQSVHGVRRLSQMYVYSKHYISSYTCGRVGFVDVCRRIRGRKDMMMRGLHLHGTGLQFLQKNCKNG